MANRQVLLKGKDFKNFFGWLRGNDSRTAAFISGKKTSFVGMQVREMKLVKEIV